jgi:hypothetical protein
LAVFSRSWQLSVCFRFNAGSVGGFPIFSRRSGISANASTFHPSNLPIFHLSTLPVFGRKKGFMEDFSMKPFGFFEKLFFNKPR